MKLTFELIKKIVRILTTLVCLGSFIVTTLCTKTKSPNFIEYTDLSKFFLNLYILILLLLCFLDSIYPRLVCKIFSDRIGIITTDKGKIFLLSAIMTMYFSTESMPQKLFGMISFVSVLGLFLAVLLLNCETLKQKPLTLQQMGINVKQEPFPETATNIENNSNVINV